MIRRLISRLGGQAGGDEAARDLASLRAEVERLRAQNEHMKRAMRQCIDCEYRIEVMASRSARGLTADGSAATAGGTTARREAHDERRSSWRDND